MYFLVDEQKMVIFGWSAKCGCSHVKRLYNFLVGNVNIDLHSTKNTEHIFPENIQDYTVIIVVRDPFERIVSGFLNKYKIGLQYYNCWTENTNAQPLTFRNFVNELVQHKFKIVNEHHFTPQLSEHWYKLSDAILGGKSPKSVIFYDIAKIDFPFLQNLYGKKIPWEIMNFKGDQMNEKTEEVDIPVCDLLQTQYANTTPLTRCFYDQDIIDKIADFYKADFDCFRSNGLVFDWSSSQISHRRVRPFFTATIVTAFISGVNFLDHPMNEHIEFGKKLLRISTPKVVFIDKQSFATYFADFASIHPESRTTFIPVDKTDIYLYNYAKEITNFFVFTNAPEKDSIESFFVRCAKTEWVAKAIDLNIYGTPQYIWLDFDIYNHCECGGSVAKFEVDIKQMTRKVYPDKLRIASIKHNGYSVDYDVHLNITWTFSGQVFGGNVDVLLKFASLVKAKVLQTIREKKSIMWVNSVWYLVYRDTNGEFMDFYYCDNLLSNY